MRVGAVGCVILMLLVGFQGIVQNTSVPAIPPGPARVQSLSMTTNPYLPSSQSIFNGTQTGGSGWTDLRDSDNVRYSYQEVDTASSSSASLLPNANGDTVSWVASGCTEANEWQCVDEDPNDGDTTYLKSTAKTVTDSLENLGTVNLNGGTVSSVVVWIWCRKAVSQTVGVRTVVKTHGSVYAGASDYNCPNSGTYGSTSTTYTTNPYTGQAWTQAELDALQAGCRDNDGSTREVRCSEVRVDVTYHVARYALEVRFAWSSLPLTGDVWTLVAEGNRSNPGAEAILVEVGQGGSSPTSWVTAYTFNTDADTSFATYALSAAELNGGAPVVRVWDNQGPMDLTQGTMGLDVLRIDLTEYRTGRNPWHYYVDGSVNADTGGLHLEFADLTAKALGWNLRIDRSYNSGLRTQDGLLGYGWTLGYDTRIVEPTAGIANWYDWDGSVLTFRDSGSAWVAPPGVDAKLTKSGNFTLWFKDGSRYAFNAIGRVATMTDRNGNDLTLTWTAYAPLQLTRVADDSGKQLNFTYRTYGPVARIQTVTDPIGRTIQYDYDGNGDLRTVTDAMGYLTYYTYDAHRLRTWREPSPAVAVGYYARKVTYAYDASDRVIEIKYASVHTWTNATDYEYVAWGLDYLAFSQYQGATRATNATNARSAVTTIDVDVSGSPLHVEGSQCGSCLAAVQPAFGATGCGTSSGGGCGGGAGGSCGGGGDGDRTEEMFLTWDSNRNLLTREDKGGHEYVYTYDAKRNLLNTTDPLGNVTQNVWATVDNATAYFATLNHTTNARGKTWYYEYDVAGNLGRIKDPTNNVSAREYDAHGYVTKMTDWRGYDTSFAYDNHGYLLNTTDATGNVTTYENDDVGRRTKRTMPDNHAWETGYDDNDRVANVTDPVNNVTMYTYNARGDLISRTDALGRTTQYEWNATNHKIARFVDALVNSTTYAYDLAGNLVKVTNARGFDTTYTYDDFNRRTVVEDALGNETLYAYDEDGLVTSVRNRRGFWTNYTYDDIHRLMTVTDALGNVTTYAYDQAGNRVSVRNARGYYTNTTFDALNHVTQVTDALGNVTLTKYDAAGNVVNQTDSNGNSDTRAYDALGRMTSSTNGAGKTTTYAYDSRSNRVRERDANGEETNYTYDALNRVVVVTDALGNTTRYDYDAVGSLRNLTDANGHTTVQAYDSLNRLVNSTTPLGKSTLYAYDANGNMRTRTDPKGNTTTYTFDALDRLTRIEYPNGSYLTATYDAESNTLTATGFGTSRTDAWDALNRVTSITFNFGPFTKTVNYTYDEVGNRRTMTYPEGQVITYTWDALNRLVDLGDSVLGSWTFDCDAGSRRTELVHPSGLKTTYAYNEADWITRMETKTSGGVVIERFNYTHDDVGNKLTVVEETGNTTTYAYDNTYRLTSESYTGGPVINYTYDGVGNRLTEVRNGVTTNYTYDADNRLTARGATTYGYDDNGNTVSRYVPGIGNTTYAYDLENRLLCVSLPNGTITEHTYSIRSQRVSTATSGVITYLMYDFYDPSSLRVEDRIADYAENGSLIARYIHGSGVDEPLALVRGTSTLFYSANAIGTVTTITMTGQSVAVSYEYEAFGSLRTASGVPANPYRFAAREWDQLAGAYDFRARWYDPVVGRFQLADPWRFVDGPNLYVYARANPPNVVDPKGLLGEDCRVPCINGGGGGGGYTPPEDPGCNFCNDRSPCYSPGCCSDPSRQECLDIMKEYKPRGCDPCVLHGGCYNRNLCLGNCLDGSRPSYGRCNFDWGCWGACMVNACAPITAPTFCTYCWATLVVPCLESLFLDVPGCILALGCVLLFGGIGCFEACSLPYPGKPG